MGRALNHLSRWNYEYAHDALPGSVNDTRGLPNLLFTVPNRRNDGVSSVSPLNPGSPRLPHYEHLLDPTVELRRNHTAMLKASQR